MRTVRVIQHEHGTTVVVDDNRVYKLPGLIRREHYLPTRASMYRLYGILHEYARSRAEITTWEVT